MGAAGTGEAREESGGASIEAGYQPHGRRLASSPSPSPVPASLAIVDGPEESDSGDAALSSVPGSSAFGTSVAFAGDLDSDGVDDFLVGAPKRSFSSPTVSNGGTVFMCYMASGGGVREVEELAFAEGDASLGGGSFGSSIAVVSGWGLESPLLFLTGGTGSSGGGLGLVSAPTAASAALSWRVAPGSAAWPGGSVSGNVMLGQAVAFLSPTWHPSEGGVVAVGAPKLGWGSVLVCRLAADGTISGGVRLSTATEGLESVVDSSMAFGAAIASQHNHGVFLLMVGAPDFDRPGLLNQDGAVVLISLNATTLGVITARRFDTSLPKLSPFGQDLSGFGSSVEWLGRHGPGYRDGRQACGWSQWVGHEGRSG
ncbi:hypothetical protein FNF29_03625 [Cafeteria roenbergensis]|uniref:Integrin alpha-2 domain-containing protein n=1 Tax=Cafeteria roenbergensis TaxID=33653 RepID=A0A5A8CIA1_CAFRO|nr:hypothetical protein FNF29_03625 [Cafeteria roenbergensis]|eukprot:KAA0152736.1 hypothetical protein FNF29_03625 [Cafeteria roenbergensis]